MGITVDKDLAVKILREEAAFEAEGKPVSEYWEEKVKELSKLCKDTSKTHIAFLGTVLLAKATNIRVDPFAVKESAGTPGAWSARGLGHQVLVPESISLKIHLGATGREPLNNQPYFRLIRISEQELLDISRSNTKPVVHLLCEMLSCLEQLSDVVEIKSALRAFIRVRRAEFRIEIKPNIPILFTYTQLLDGLSFLTEVSEGGKRAQAAVAGIIDVMVGDVSRVLLGKINDPDRHFPGDMSVIKVGGVYDRVFEVRDEIVSESDVAFFTRKLGMARIARGGIIALHKGQSENVVKDVDDDILVCQIFIGWKAFVDSSCFWGNCLGSDVWLQVWTRIRVRMVEIGVSDDTLRLWDKIGSTSS